jgi:hypothetical protein
VAINGAPLSLKTFLQNSDALRQSFAISFSTARDSGEPITTDL